MPGEHCLPSSALEPSPPRPPAPRAGASPPGTEGINCHEELASRETQLCAADDQGPHVRMENPVLERRVLAGGRTGGHHPGVLSASLSPREKGSSSECWWGGRDGLSPLLSTDRSKELGVCKDRGWAEVCSFPGIQTTLLLLAGKSPSPHLREPPGLELSRLLLAPPSAQCPVGREGQGSSLPQRQGQNGQRLSAC